MVDQLRSQRSDVLSGRIQVQAEVQAAVQHQTLRNRAQSAVQTRSGGVEGAAGVLLGERRSGRVVVGDWTAHVGVGDVQARAALGVLHDLAEDHQAGLLVLVLVACKAANWSVS